MVKRTDDDWTWVVRLAVLVVILYAAAWLLLGCAARTDLALDNASTLAGVKADILAEVENQFDLALKKLVQVAQGGSDNVTQQSGRNSINVSPEIVVSGGAGVVIVVVVVAGLVLAIRRRDRGLNIIMKEIDDGHYAPLQDDIKARSIENGLEPWLKRKVKARRKKDRRR